MDKLNIEDFKSNQPEKIDFKSMEKNSFIDVKKPLAPPPVAISMGTYTYKGYDYPIPFGTYGNFSCLVGASKSMKTFMKSAIIAGYIGGNSNHYFDELRGHDTKGKFVLDIDTEQSEWHTQKVAKRVCEMVGANYEYYKPYSTREYDAKIRMEYIEYLVMESEFKGNVGFVSIDGVADIVENVNDLKESNKVMNALMRMTTKANCHILTVIHRNHGSDKATGHVGSAIMKKAETVAFVTRDGDQTKVTPDYTRNYPFSEFYFELDHHHLPRLADNTPKPF